jgi:uncharacterized repeat protein (TIGR01451 family)
MLLRGLLTDDRHARTRVRARRLLPGVLAAVAVAMVGPVSTAAAATFTVTTTADSGAGSLRQALTDVSAAGTGHTIAFAIPGSGPHVIAPASLLPNIGRDNTTIDGCTQPGADCGTRPLTLAVQLHGQGLGAGAHGVTIRGLSITGAATGIANNRFARDGRFQVSQDLTVEKNLLGIAPDGSAAGNTQVFGLQIGNRGLNQDGLRILDNVIASNTNTAIDLRAGGFSTPRAIQRLRIEGNLIGMDPTGTQARPNGGDGIVVAWSAGARIVGNRVAGSPGVGIRHLGRTQAVPGSDPAVDPGLLIEGNVVEGNAGGGIVLAPNLPTLGPAGSDPNSGPARVFGNTVADNGTAGVSVTAATGMLRPNILIGGTAPGERNTITGSDGPGVAVGTSTSDTSVAVTVRGNSIFANSGPAIDLGSDGPTENGEPLVARSGPNLLLNHPLIDSIAHGSVIVNGTYTGAANATYTLDFYASDTADGPQTWIGSAPVTTDATGTATFSATFNGNLPEGWTVNATATDADGNTSEFAATAAVVPPLPPAPEPPADSGPQGQPPSGTDGSGQAPGRGTGRIRKPRLRLTETADRRTLRAGQTATFVVQLRNPSKRAIRTVRTCVVLPPGLVAVRSNPRAGLSQGRRCWTAARLAAGGSRTYRLTVRALPGAAGRKVSRVTARSREARGVAQAAQAVRVLPSQAVGGGVTG